MSRQIDIDLLVPKILKFKAKCSDTKIFTVSQVLWMLEQEFAWQNGITNNMCSSHQNNDRSQCIETMIDMAQNSIKVHDCQNELSEIKNGKVIIKIVDEHICLKT